MGAGVDDDHLNLYWSQDQPGQNTRFLSTLVDGHLRTSRRSTSSTNPARRPGSQRLSTPGRRRSNAETLDDLVGRQQRGESKIGTAGVSRSTPADGVRVPPVSGSPRTVEHPVTRVREGTPRRQREHPRSAIPPAGRDLRNRWLMMEVAASGQRLVTAGGQIVVAAIPRARNMGIAHTEMGTGSRWRPDSGRSRSTWAEAGRHEGVGHGPDGPDPVGYACHLT
jgi:hypothetical protein